MLWTVVFSVVSVAAAGLLIKFLLDRSSHPAEITWQEFGIGLAVATIVISPLVGWAGFRVARSNNVTFTEYWNGWELEAVKQDISCTRDGSCSRTYDCDPYLVPVFYPCNCDDKGNCSTCMTLETRYHSCPYATVESTYTIQTTLGDYEIDAHRFPENAQSHRWRKSVAIPPGLISRVGEGAPPFWSEAKIRIERNAPGPVSTRKDYENYILASDRTILKQYSSDIERLRQANLLPPIASSILDFYLADKVAFVGYRPEDPVAWQRALRYLNAALGSELQGDLHLVIVGDPSANQNPDVYALALRAYWQNRSVFEKNCLAKNGIVVVVGTADNKTTSWARAFTGMPMGNEALTVAIRNELKAQPLTPERILGGVRGEFRLSNGKKDVQGLHGKGAIERILWGLDEPATKFTRISMRADDPGGVGSGYLYLLGEVELTSKQLAAIAFLEFLASLGVWLAAALIGERRKRSRAGN